MQSTAIMSYPTVRFNDISGAIRLAISNWSNDGKAQFDHLYNLLLNEQNDKLEAELATKELLISLCKSCLNGNFTVETTVKAFTELQETLSNDAFGQILADVFATLDIEISPADETTTDIYKQKFFQLINNSEHIVSTSLLMERLEIEALESLDLIVNRENFSQKYVRIKTRLFYKQQKFNLLREESEGFSKALTELNQDFTLSLTTADILYERIMALIGYFDIDPNRILDLVLESFECQLKHSQIFIELLKLLHYDQKTICQLLGFKFQTYKNQDETPDSLYLLAAMLISNNLANLDQLLPHLNSSISEISDIYNKELEQARTSKKTTVSLGTITTDNSSNNSNTKSKENSLKPNDQVLNLLRSLLAVGDLKSAKILFDLFPRCACTSYKEIYSTLCKIIDYIIDPLYKSHAELHQKFLNYKISYPLNVVYTMSNSQLTQLSTFDEFRIQILPLLLHLGPYCQDRLVYIKLIRICTTIMKTKYDDLSKLDSSSGDSDELYENLLLIIDELLLPSLSLMDMNGCMAIELWNLLKLFPFDVRYKLYAKWQEDTYKLSIHLVQVKNEVLEKSKAILRRITKDNVKTFSRQIAKITHCNPTIILSCIIDQIQRYDNFINVIIDALKYLSPLAYDVVCYMILRALTTIPASSSTLPLASNNLDGKMSRDNATPSQWFQNICTLLANTLKKYPIDFTSILYYIYDQLCLEKSYDLFLLREIITKMSGVEISAAVTAHQLDAAAGGELLRNEAGNFTAARNVKKPSIRLKEALLENSIYLPLSIIIAQQRNCIVFKFGAQRHEHLKLIGNLYDQCQDTMVQFYTFLSNVLTSENFLTTFPSIKDLVLGFHLQVDAAFHISRPLFNLNVQAKFDELKQNNITSKAMTKSQEKTFLTQKYIESVNFVMSPVLDMVKSLHPKRTWEEMTPQFYMTFWSLSMSDLYVPEQSYKRRIQALEQEMVQNDDRKELTQAKKRKEKDKINSIIDKLAEELIKQKEHVEHVRARLDVEKDDWFKNRNRTKAETITEFLQLCIFPRCLLSEIDALYCAQFIRIIHDLATPNFSTIICYDRIFSDISYSLASCSENEAIRYGRFLLCLLETVMSWHSDKVKYEKECSSHPGFLTVFRNSVTAPSLNKTIGSTTSLSASQQLPEQLDYENYRHVCHKWHYKLAKSFIVCLDSTDYIQIRNVLQVLTVLLPIYPRITTFYTALERRIKNICNAEKDKRPDLFALAKCYNGRLSHKYQDMCEENQFHVVPEKMAPIQTSSTSTNKIASSANSNATATGSTITASTAATVTATVAIGQQSRSTTPTITNGVMTANSTTKPSSSVTTDKQQSSSLPSTSIPPQTPPSSATGYKQKSASPAPAQITAKTSSVALTSTPASSKKPSDTSTIAAVTDAHDRSAKLTIQNEATEISLSTQSAKVKLDRTLHGPSVPTTSTTPPSNPGGPLQLKSSSTDLQVKVKSENIDPKQQSTRMIKLTSSGEKTNNNSEHSSSSHHQSHRLDTEKKDSRQSNTTTTLTIKKEPKEQTGSSNSRRQQAPAIDSLSHKDKERRTDSDNNTTSPKTLTERTSSLPSSSTRSVELPSSRRSSPRHVTTDDDAAKRSDLINGSKFSSSSNTIDSSSIKASRGLSPEPVQPDKKRRAGSSKGSDRIVTRGNGETTSGRVERHRDRKSDFTSPEVKKRIRSQSHDKNPSLNLRRLNNTTDAIISNSNSANDDNDSLPQLATSSSHPKRIKTTAPTENERGHTLTEQQKSSFLKENDSGKKGSPSKKDYREDRHERNLRASSSRDRREK